MARIDLTPGFVLHARAYRETSLLLEAFTRAQGRVGLVARGARSARSRLRGILRPFQPLLISWTGRGELGTLTGAEGTAPASLTSGRALTGGLYINELLVRLLPRSDPHPALFDAYRAVLPGLASAVDPEPVLRLFEKQLLSELGYALVLDRDAEGRPLRPGAVYHYHLESGARPVEASREGMLLVHGSSLRALAEGRLDDPLALAEAKRLNRAALAHYLGGRALRSRELLRRPRGKNREQ